MADLFKVELSFFSAVVHFCFFLQEGASNTTQKTWQANNFIYFSKRGHIMQMSRCISVFSVSTFIILPVLQHLFSPSVWTLTLGCWLPCRVSDAGSGYESGEIVLDWVSRMRTQPPGQLSHRPTKVLLWQIVGFTIVWSFIQCTELRPNANLLKNFRSKSPLGIKIKTV